MENPTRRAHTMPFGAELRAEGGVRFRIWAPTQATMTLTVEGRGDPVPMTALADGWHECVVDDLGAGARYRFGLADGNAVPDAASRHQPNDVHGPSEVIDPRGYAWGDGAWRGRPWEEAVLYELHVGAFTPEGTFRAAIDRLDDLVALGITAIELMPIADFPGARNWGYDGVCLFAPDASYGRPDDPKALVDAAHARGLMVLLDVVYNHFGPEGNYLGAYAAPFFTNRHETPWGAAINFASPTVRDFTIHNALYWLEEYHFDGLRLDAVQAIMDDSEQHLLEELAERVRDHLGGERAIHLILENEENLASLLERDAAGRPEHYTAQWNDDVHHVLHTAATGEDAGYYADYAGDTRQLARALAEGFSFQGEMMPYRGSPRGEASRHLPPTAFVSFIQNHDQIGNRAFGERLTTIAPAHVVRLVAAMYLLAPQIPMLFMGEEWGASQPFPFFCDFGPALAEAVRNGRRAEFARFPEFRDAATREQIPDPIGEGTYLAAKLGWDDRRRAPHDEWLAWYQRLLALRHAEIVPRLAGIGGHAGEHAIVGEGGVAVTWRMGDGSRLNLLANPSEGPLSGVATPAGRRLWQEGAVTADGVGAWSLIWSLETHDGAVA
ncbi:MAG: malto-oligosyltrehalose trehalohydrolase [Bauldia litoralis]|uniref:malto-oligosyltrehalose trehalohydrolase n=1 Tax=Bauldia litoralis TaxID=665467 RepID=UPI003298D690